MMRFEKQARDFGAPKKKVVRPLQRKMWRSAPCDIRYGLMQRHASDKSKLWGQKRFAGINQEEAGVKIALRRDP